MIWVHCYFLARVRSIRRSKSRSKNPTGYPTRFMHAMLFYTSSTIEIANPNSSTSRESWRGVTAKNNPFWDAYKGYLYLESLVSANRLFMMPKAPTPPEKPFCRELPHTVLGYPFADSDSCFCMMASEILLDPVKSRMEIISPESLRPSVSLSARPVRVRRPGEASASEARAGPDGVAASQESVGFAAALAAHAAHFPQHPIEDLLDDDWDDVEERVDATYSSQDKEEVGQPVKSLVAVRSVLAAHQISKTNGAEGDEAKIQRVQIRPAFDRSVHGRRAAGDHDGR